MHEIDRYVEDACRPVAGSHAMRERIREELRAHLEEAFEGHVAEGLTREEALEKTLEEFGGSRQVSEGFQDLYGRRLTSFMIEKACDWKEATVKAEMRGHFVTYFCLALASICAILFIAGAEVYILPKLVHGYREVGTSLPAFSLSIWNTLLFVTGTWWIWLSALVIAGILFERRYRGDSKSALRLAAASFLCSLVTCAAIVAASALAVSFALLPVAPPASAVEGRLEGHIAGAARSFAALEERSAAGDWSGAASACRDLEDDIESLERLRASAPAIALFGRQATMGAIVRLLGEIADTADDAGSRVPAGDGERMREQVAAISAAYRKLVPLVEGWPETAGGPTGTPGAK